MRPADQEIGRDAEVGAEGDRLLPLFQGIKPGTDPDGAGDPPGSFASVEKAGTVSASDDRGKLRPATQNQGKGNAYDEKELDEDNGT